MLLQQSLCRVPNAIAVVVDKHKPALLPCGWRAARTELGSLTLIGQDAVMHGLGHAQGNSFFSAQSLSARRQRGVQHVLCRSLNLNFVLNPAHG